MGGRQDMNPGSIHSIFIFSSVLFYLPQTKFAELKMLFKFTQNFIVP